jgi:toxin ParE1/3/4
MEQALMTIEWASSAVENLQEIYSETSILNSSAAESVLKKLLDEVDDLASSPMIGREGRVEDTRELPVSAMPLVISFRVSGNVTQILAILQGAAISIWPRVRKLNMPVFIFIKKGQSTFQSE